MKRLLLLALVACGGVAAVLTISPAAAAVSPGQTIQFMAEGATAVTWTVVETGGGTVSSSGLYTAPACPTVGTFHVQAAAGGKSVQATVTVADTVASLTISPTTASLAPGQTQQFTATETSGCGIVTSAAMLITAPKK